LTGKVLILGGYGNFGKRIARALTAGGTPVVIAGRNAARASAFVAELPAGRAEATAFDAHQSLHEQLASIRPAVVVNTCGPFQTSDYGIAKTCIEAGVHYIDLADGRDFVTGIAALDARARAGGVAVISGASTVPGLSSAVIEHLRPAFADMQSLRFGISPGQKAERGLATTAGIMTYVGKPLRAFAGDDGPSFGWQGIYRQPFPILGRRWMANCDIPDLDLFPQHYGFRSIRFYAGLELTPLHLGLWALSWAVRLGLPLHLPRQAGWLLRASNLFDRFGSADGGMFMLIGGLDHNGRSIAHRWFIVAKDGEGPQIPTIPAIVLARKAAQGTLTFRGAGPCVGLVSLDEYRQELEGYPIEILSDFTAAN
jgi:hypothetical protein